MAITTRTLVNRRNVGKCMRALRAPQLSQVSQSQVADVNCAFPSNCSRASIGSIDDDSQVLVSKTRFNELLRAEIAHFSTVPVRALSIGEILKYRELEQLVEFIQTEVPKRFAMRLRMIEALSGWERVPQLRELYDMLTSWYRILALAPGKCDLRDFLYRCDQMRAEGRMVVGKLAVGIRQLRRCQGGEYDDDFLNRWMNGFLLSRIGSNMLIDQYRATVPKEYGGRYCRPTGLIDVNCDATRVCEQAAHYARQLCYEHFGKRPNFSIENFVAGKSGPQPSGSCTFSYVPGYLRYIVMELMKNSFHATIQKARSDAEMHAIRIIVCCDEHRVAMRISDRGGGIPFEVGDNIWSYLFGAAAGSTDHTPTALAGYGVGLPLSRMHAIYLGGKLHITTYPGHGTDAHLLLPRIDSEQIEKMPNGNW